MHAESDTCAITPTTSPASTAALAPHVRAALSLSLAHRLVWLTHSHSVSAQCIAVHSSDTRRQAERLIHRQKEDGSALADPYTGTLACADLLASHRASAAGILLSSSWSAHGTLLQFCSLVNRHRLRIAGSVCTRTSALSHSLTHCTGQCSVRAARLASESEGMF